MHVHDCFPLGCVSTEEEVQNGLVLTAGHTFGGIGVEYEEGVMILGVLHQEYD